MSREGTEDGGRRAEDGRRMTEDRRQRTEGGGRTSEGMEGLLLVPCGKGRTFEKPFCMWMQMDDTDP